MVATVGLSVFSLAEAQVAWSYKLFHWGEGNFSYKPSGGPRSHGSSFWGDFFAVYMCVVGIPGHIFKTIFLLWSYVQAPSHFSIPHVVDGRDLGTYPIDVLCNPICRTVLNGIHSPVGDLDHLVQGDETCLVWRCVCVHGRVEEDDSECISYSHENDRGCL